MLKCKDILAVMRNKITILIKLNNLRGRFHKLKVMDQIVLITNLEN